MDAGVWPHTDDCCVPGQSAMEMSARTSLVAFAIRVVVQNRPLVLALLFAACTYLLKTWEENRIPKWI